MRGVVPLLIFLQEASINTFLYLALYSFNLFLRSGVVTASRSRFLKLRFECQVHLDESFAVKTWTRGAEHLLIGEKQFLQSRVKSHTLNFLCQILVSKEVALTTLILFLPIISFGQVTCCPSTPGDTVACSSESTPGVPLGQVVCRAHHPPQTIWKNSKSV